MKTASKFFVGSLAAALMTFTLGCQPAKPPAPEGGSEPAAETSNTTGNTTAGSETPAGETP